MFTAKIDRQNHVITIPRAALIAAGQFGTPEFHQMMEMRKEFPGYTFEEQRIARNPDKQTHGNLTYDVMQAFIENHDVEETVCAEALKEYETIKKISRTQRAAYAFVKKWFLGKYGKEFADFQKKRDEKKRAAKEEYLIYNPDMDKEE